MRSETPRPRAIPASSSRYCPRCRQGRPADSALCPECGESLALPGYCPICEGNWTLSAGAQCPKHDVDLEDAPPERPAWGRPGEPSALITLGRFADAGRAEALRIRLEAEGIPTFLQGERMGRLSMYQVATGGMALQVPQDFAADARIILSQTWADPFEADDLEDAWDDLAPEPGAHRRAIMKGLILLVLAAPLLLTLLALGLRR